MSARRMRVAYLLTQDRGGPVEVTVRLAASLAASGEAEVRVFGPRPARGGELLDGHHEQVSIPSKGSVAAARSAWSAIRSWRPDLVHAQDRRSGLVCAGMHRLPAGPRAVVQTYHGVPDDVTEQWFRGTPTASGPSAYTRAVLTADAVVARAVSRTVVPTPAMGGFLRRRLRVPATRLAHIDNCADLPPFDPPSGQVRHLVFVGLLVERKGTLDLLQALAMPGTMPPGATLTVIGDGPQRADAERLASRPPLAGRVHFLGFRADVPELLAHGDALVLPSRMEQQPLVVAEAMAAGKPVLATDTGGVADMLDVPGAARYLAAPGDVHGLAATLRKLFDDPDPAGTGRALAAAARRRFSPGTCAESHLALYRDVLAR